MESFHYKWSDLSDSGYSLLGHIFQNYGAATVTLDSAPTQSNLAQANFYIIASPDIPIKNPHPNYMSDHDADGVAAWVKKGGVLILMENDPPNADVSHLNLLADILAFTSTMFFIITSSASRLKTAEFLLRRRGRFCSSFAHSLYEGHMRDLAQRNTRRVAARSRGCCHGGREVRTGHGIRRR